MKAEGEYTGSAEAIINEEKHTATVSFSVKEERILSCHLVCVPSTTTIKQWCDNIANHLLNKRVAEAGRLTPLFLAHFLRLKKGEELFADLFTRAITAAFYDYCEKKSSNLFQQTVTLLTDYEKDVPQRTIEDIGYEYGDCGCIKKDHEHAD